MSYNADIYRVMIASPSDVQEERRIIRKIIYEWNIVHSEKERIVLLPVGWESDSYPQMGNRAQEIINSQLVSVCDLLVAVFWTRLGSSTGKSESGTIEEIEKHLDMGKPTMIYFSSAPVRLDSVDESQYQALRKFKSKCQLSGLVESYESIGEFREKFRRQLGQTVNKHFAIEDKEVIGTEIPISKSEISISEAAKELLLEAVKDAGGTIIRAPYIGGIDIETNGRAFVTDRNPRTAAKWEDAIKELEEYVLIEDKGYKRQIFSVTHRGYKLADDIKK